MRNILLLVDLQKDFIDGTLAVPGASSVLPAIDRIKSRFDRVYFTLDWHPTDHCSFREQGGPWPVHCVHYTEGAALDSRALAGIPESRMRFILKGCAPAPDEYGAFVAFDPDNQDLFAPGDEVVICGIAAEYCVVETLRNLYEISRRIGFTVKVYLEGTARFDNVDAILAFMAEHGIARYTAE